MNFLVRTIMMLAMVTWYIITRSYIPVAAWMILSFIGSEMTGFHIDSLYRAIFKTDVRR